MNDKSIIDRLEKLLDIILEQNKIVGKLHGDMIDIIDIFKRELNNNSTPLLDQINSPEVILESSPVEKVLDAPKRGRGRPKKEVVHEQAAPVEQKAIELAPQEPPQSTNIEAKKYKYSDNTEWSLMTKSWTIKQLNEAYALMCKKVPPRGATTGELADEIIEVRMKSIKKEEDIEVPQVQAPDNYPSDPMPNHKEAHKIFYKDVSVWECDKCQNDALIMCLPSCDLEGKLYASYKCQNCQHEETMEMTKSDAEQVRKIAKVCLDVPPYAHKSEETQKNQGGRGALVDHQRKAGRGKVENQSPQAGRCDIENHDNEAGRDGFLPILEKSMAKARAGRISVENQQGTAGRGSVENQPSEAGQTTKENQRKQAFDPSKVVSDILGEDFSPPINKEILLQELSVQIGEWSFEKQVLEWERLSGKKISELSPMGREAFAKTEMIPFIASKMAGCSVGL
jgi:hypothetical protein